MKSWNEIRKAATAFSKRWKNAYDEKAQAQSFLKEFFAVFGVDTVVFNAFEHRVKFTDGSQGYADCFWQGTILVEMKSAGKDLDAAYQQAMDYVRTLPPADYPRAVVVSDFQRFRFYNLEKDNALTEFALRDLRRYVTLFGYMIGADDGGELREQDPVNRKAAEQMARLHDAMKAVGYTGHPLEVYLVRLLFCLFAEDTGIFKPDQSSHCVCERTAADGSDLAAKLAELFQVLNTPKEKRLASRDETIAKFPYVNGGLFAEMLPIAAFSAEMRKAILDCAALDWSKISPAIFGAMFQGVMDEKARHDLGAHYTAEEYILRLIRPLFLDALRAEFNAICALNGKTKETRLTAFHEKIASLTFLAPACGCGNFLLIAYRELRRLEMDVLEELHRDDPEQFLDISQLCKVSVSQFYGIEIEQFPAEIAKVALWLMDHLCNMEVADRFGQYFARIPIKDSPHIVCANALRIDWSSLLNASVKCKMESVKLQEANQAPNFTLYTLHSSFSYILGNPPFLGASSDGMDAAKKADMLTLFPKNKNLDFVCGWYKKANDIIQGTATRCAFVSTNSITQGEQVAALWKNLNAEIDFAYRTFKWHNEAKGNAAVHCVIIGFHAKGGNVANVKMLPMANSNSQLKTGNIGTGNTSTLAKLAKTIYDPDGTAIPATHINGYLMDAPDIIVESRNKSLCDVPQMVYGNKPTDGGNLILTPEEKDALLAAEPQAAQFIRPLLGAEEYIHGKTRYCIWLVDADVTLLNKCPLVKARIEAVRQFRSASKKAATRKKADYAMLFDEVRQPKSGNFIVVPRVTSERRKYVPIGFLSAETVVTDLIQMIPDATLYHFGILSSRMHMAWMRAVAGRLKSDYRYSKDIVYNNFIWPDVDECKMESVKCKMGGSESQGDTATLHFTLYTLHSICAAAQMVLDARAAHPNATLADLYDPLTMPPDLVKAHAHLDTLVDKAYGLSPSCTDADRVAHLFKLYAEKVNKA